VFYSACSLITLETSPFQQQLTSATGCYHSYPRKWCHAIAKIQCDLPDMKRIRSLLLTAVVIALSLPDVSCVTRKRARTVREGAYQSVLGFDNSVALETNTHQTTSRKSGKKKVRGIATGQTSFWRLSSPRANDMMTRKPLIRTG